MQCRFHELGKAASVAEILAVVRDHLSTWTHDEIAALPAACRPSRVHTTQDIELWADRLLEAGRRLTLLMDDERRLDKLTSHFLIASVRIRQLLGRRLALAA